MSDKLISIIEKIGFKRKEPFEKCVWEGVLPKTKFYTLIHVGFENLLIECVAKNNTYWNKFEFNNLTLDKSFVLKLLKEIEEDIKNKGKEL